MDKLIMTISLIIMLCFIVSLYLAMGVIVYQDAKTHRMSGLLWALIAMFAPGFIGVIIYLIVRSNKEKVYYCSACDGKIKEDYNICPYCQSVLEAYCHICNRTVLEDLKTCPYCGTDLDQETCTKTASKVVQASHIKKPLLIIGCIFLVLLMLLILKVLCTLPLDHLLKIVLNSMA